MGLEDLCVIAGRRRPVAIGRRKLSALLRQLFSPAFNSSDGRIPSGLQPADGVRRRGPGSGIDFCLLASRRNAIVGSVHTGNGN